MLLVELTGTVSNSAGQWVNIEMFESLHVLRKNRTPLLKVSIFSSENLIDSGPCGLEKLSALACSL